MPSLTSLVGLPVSLFAALSLAAGDATRPTAIRKLSPDSGEKLLAEHLGFAPLDLPLAFAPLEPERNCTTARLHNRAFAAHYDSNEAHSYRRAAGALAALQRRSSCPSGMNSCADIGSPNKCCQEGTYCTDVPDTTVGHVACCPIGVECDGGVGECPSNAVSCPASLGGGCCISGFVCQGNGCIRSEIATQPQTTTQTQVQTSTRNPPPQTITDIRTTFINGEASTVYVTLTVTQETSEEPTTVTDTETVTASVTTTVAGAAPWRPTTDPGSSETTTSESDSSQEGCPTGFYGCLANHGGGCCRTDRNCETHSCPAQASTTIFDGSATVVVPAADVPTSAESTCAEGWFLCGRDAGPVAGCCPSGFDCGTASCFTVSASQTGQVQKVFPEDSMGTRGSWVNDVVRTGAISLLVLGYLL